MHDKFGFASVFFHSNCRQSPADSRQDIKHVERQTSSIKNDNYSVHLQKLTFDISDYDLGRVVGGEEGLVVMSHFSSRIHKQDQRESPSRCKYAQKVLSDSELYFVSSDDEVDNLSILFAPNSKFVPFPLYLLNSE